MTELPLPCVNEQARDCVNSNPANCTKEQREIDALDVGSSRVNEHHVDQRSESDHSNHKPDVG